LILGGSEDEMNGVVTLLSQTPDEISKFNMRHIEKLSELTKKSDKLLEKVGDLISSHQNDEDEEEEKRSSKKSKSTKDGKTVLKIYYIYD